MNSLLDFLLLPFQLIYYYIDIVFRFFVPTERKDVTNKIVLITGGGQGIGRLVAINFARLGSRIVLWDINEKTLAAVADELMDLGSAGGVFTYTCDVSNNDSVKKAAAKVKADVGDVDILVNNAGIMLVKPFMELTERDIQRVIGINTTGLFWTTQAFLPAMKSKNCGHIVNMASLAGLFGIPNLVDYCASKFGVVGMSEALRNELVDTGYDGVHVTYICPHATNTNLLDACTIESKLPFKPLDPVDVAKRIVDATLRNEYRILIPGVFNVLYLWMNLLPQKAVWALADKIKLSMVPKQNHDSAKKVN